MFSVLNARRKTRQNEGGYSEKIAEKHGFLSSGMLLKAYTHL